MSKSQQVADPDTGKSRPDDRGWFIWDVDPTSVALDESDARRRGNADSPAVPTEVGRRMLLSYFTMGSWVLRRVEKARFLSDRRIARSSTIEFRVPPEAPQIHSPGAEPRWLIPLSVMRRHTLVNFDLTTDGGASVSLFGLRFTQKLDESMLRAAARLARPDIRDHTEVDRFIHDAVSGNWWAVYDSFYTYELWRHSRNSSRETPPTQERHARVQELARYFRDPVFRVTLERLWDNFTLYVSVPVGDRHRMVRLAFEERIDWRYRGAELTPDTAEADGREACSYEPAAHRCKLGRLLGHLLGWRAARIRFMVPSAENCASYHFEFTAPTGVWITEAALVAGRPNESAPRRTSWDAVARAQHSVGLHAVEVPSGSLCRAQVDLRLPTRGWLSTLAVSCIAVYLTLAMVAVHARMYGAEGHWGGTQVTNMILLLVTVSAGASTFVAQHPAGDVAAHMVTALRIAGVVALTLPAIAAAILLLLKEHHIRRDTGVAQRELISDQITRGGLLLRIALCVLMVAAVLCLALVLAACAKSRNDERRRGRPSPWDFTTAVRPPANDGQMGEGEGKSQLTTPLCGERMSFSQLVHALGFDEEAVEVYSAEGWHRRYGWTDDCQKLAVDRLRGGLVSCWRRESRP